MSSRVLPFGVAASAKKLSDDVGLNNMPLILSAFIYHIIHSVLWESWIQLSNFRTIVMWMF